MLSHIHAVNYSTSHNTKCYLGTREKLCSSTNRQSIQHSVQNKKQLAMPTVVIKVPCHQWWHWWCDARVLHLLKPWWVMSCTGLTLSSHNVHKLSSYFSLGWPHLLLPSILPVTTKFSRPHLLMTWLRKASCHWPILFTTVCCTPASFFYYFLITFLLSPWYRKHPPYRL